MMKAGPRDRLITIERATSTPGPMNAPVLTWAPLAKVWASKRDVSDAERVAAAEVSAEITARFQILYSSRVASVNPKDRIICQGQVFDISAVKEIGRRDGLEITAAARSDQ